MSKKICTSKALFIKLGQGGDFEDECIKKRQILKIDYREANHDLCLRGKWEKLKEFFTDKMHYQKGVATYHVTQIKYFYEEGKDVLWITFCDNKLWWCFSKKEITIENDKTKIRPVIGKWSCKDLKGKILFLEDINGRLLRTQGFRGTICSVAEKDYLLAKINGDQPKEIKEVEEVFNDLKEKIAHLIKRLRPKDFELLIDLIFRNSGWQRLGTLGKTQKLIDIAIYHPITGERAVVQIKCQSGLREFKEYEKTFLNMTEYDKFFYITHTPEPSLEQYKSEDINIYFANKVAEMTINAGLFDWVIKTVG